MTSTLLENLMYSGGFGKTSKELAAEFVTNRFDQFIMDPEEDHGQFDDDASSRLNQLLKDRPISMKRLAKLDELNPREALPIDLRQIKEIDRIPNMFPYALDITSKEDYTVRQRVGLVQDAFRNYLSASDALNPRHAHEATERTSSDIFGQREKGKKANELYTPDGSAAGLISNHLDEMGYMLRSIESVSAF